MKPSFKCWFYVQCVKCVSCLTTESIGDHNYDFPSIPQGRDIPLKKMFQDFSMPFILKTNDSDDSEDKRSFH